MLHASVVYFYMLSTGQTHPFKAHFVKMTSVGGNLLNVVMLQTQLQFTVAECDIFKGTTATVLLQNS